MKGTRTKRLYNMLPAYLGVLMSCLEGVRRQSYSTLGLQIDDKMVYLELSSRWLLVSNLS